ncbi:MAG: bifunctional enoyl-CoA hydratase/phosphate acetyltransferase [Candidatus Zixiibacteriota bacterium]|nr:MAG: bifunctional enoyl-CoA hydratase/phosphate acetyltransferase [candidate division Zixibacteria bacterium]
MSGTSESAVPSVRSFEQIRDKAARIVSEKGKPRAAVVVPLDIHTFRAVARADHEGLIEPYMIGDERLARQTALQNGIDVGSVNFVNISEPEAAVQTAIRMAVGEELDILINGRVPAVELLKQVLNRENSYLPEGSVLSHVAVMKPSLYDKLLLLSDAAVNMEPALQTKLAIVDNAVRVADVIGISMPRVAIIAAVEVISPQMPVTIDAAIIAKMADRKQIVGAYVDGPLSFDVAVDVAAARAKGIEDSLVAGQADILIAPDIATANGVYRAMTLFGNAAMGGMIVGGKVPLVLNSRSDTTDNRFNSIVLAALAVASDR